MWLAALAIVGGYLIYRSYTTAPAAQATKSLEAEAKSKASSALELHAAGLVAEATQAAHEAAVAWKRVAESRQGKKDEKGARAALAQAGAAEALAARAFEGH